MKKLLMCMVVLIHVNVVHAAGFFGGIVNNDALRKTLSWYMLSEGDAKGVSDVFRVDPTIYHSPNQTCDHCSTEGHADRCCVGITMKVSKCMLMRLYLQDIMTRFPMAAIGGVLGGSLIGVPGAALGFMAVAKTIYEYIPYIKRDPESECNHPVNSSLLRRLPNGSYTFNGQPCWTRPEE